MDLGKGEDLMAGLGDLDKKPKLKSFFVDFY